MSAEFAFAESRAVGTLVVTVVTGIILRAADDLPGPEFSAGRAPALKNVDYDQQADQANDDQS